MNNIISKNYLLFIQVYFLDETDYNISNSAQTVMALIQNRIFTSLDSLDNKVAFCDIQQIKTNSGFQEPSDITYHLSMADTCYSSEIENMRPVIK